MADICCIVELDLGSEMLTLGTTDVSCQSVTVATSVQQLQFLCDCHHGDVVGLVCLIKFKCYNHHVEINNRSYKVRCHHVSRMSEDSYQVTFSYYELNASQRRLIKKAMSRLESVR